MADLGPRREDEELCEKPMREAVGNLLWVSGMTRPDIVNAVRAVARQTHNPSSRYWEAVVKIIAYLKRTKEPGLLFLIGGDFVLSVYVDADYASQSNWRRSVSGVVVMLGGTVISASSSTQHCVTLSTSEAEYVAITQGARMILFTKAVLEFLQPQISGRTVDVFEDNQGAIALAENPMSAGRTKHIDVRYHFIRELVEKKVLRMVYCKTEEQPADELTEPLARGGRLNGTGVS